MCFEGLEEMYEMHECFIRFPLDICNWYCVSYSLISITVLSCYDKLIVVQLNLLSSSVRTMMASLTFPFPFEVLANTVIL